MDFFSVKPVFFSLDQKFNSIIAIECKMIWEISFSNKVIAYDTLTTIQTKRYGRMADLHVNRRSIELVQIARVTYA